MKTSRWLPIALLVGLINAVVAFSQSATIVSPVDSSTNVGLDSYFEIHLSHPIDSASVLLNGDDDTISNHIRVRAVLMPKLLEGYFPDSVLALFNYLCKVTIYNDTTLRVIPISDLPDNIEMTLYVDSIGLDTTGGVAYVRTDTVLFKTEYGVHRLWGIDMPLIGRMRRVDTIDIKLNRPLDSLKSPDGQNIVRLLRLDSTVIDTNYYTDFSTNIWLDPTDSSIIHATWTASNVNEQGLYYLRTNLHGFTSDSGDIKDHKLQIRNRYSLNLVVETTDLGSYTEVVLPKAGTSYFDYDTTVTAAILEENANYVFDHWISNVPSIDGSLDPTIDVTIGSAAGVDAVVLTAVMRRKDTITVQVDSISNWRVSVRNSSGDSIGTQGVYSVLPNDYLIVDTWYTGVGTKGFSGWSSSSVSLNNVTNTIVKVKNKGVNITLTPGGGFTTSCGTGSMSAHGFIDDGWSLNRAGDWFQGGEDPTGILTVTPANSSGTVNTTVNVTASIATGRQNCFCLDSMIVKEPNKPTVRTALGCVNTVTVPIPRTCPATIVYFTAKRKPVSYSLTVETQLINPRDFDELGTPEKSKHIGEKRDVTIGVFRLNRAGEEQLIGYTDQDVNSGDLTQSFPCDCKVRMRRYLNLREKGFGFIEWMNPSSLSWGTSGSGGTFNTYPLDPVASEFDFLMNMNRLAKGVFRQNFHLRRVALWLENQGIYTWYTVDQLKTINSTGAVLEIGEVTSSRDIGLYKSGTKYGTEIYYEFDDDVDNTTVVGNVWSSDLSLRPDLEDKQEYGLASGYHTVTGNEVDLRLYITPTPSTGPIGANKGTAVYNQVTELVENTSGETLDPTTAVKFLMLTELPGARVIYKSIKPLNDMGDLDNDVDVLVSATCVSPEEATITAVPLNDPEEDCYVEVDENATHVFNQEIAFFEHNTWGEGFNISTNAWDVDLDAACDPEERAAYLGSTDSLAAALIIAGATYLLAAGIPGAGVPFHPIISPIVGFGLIVAGLAILIFRNPSDEMGTFNSTRTWWDWFGTDPKTNVNPRTTVNDNYEERIEVELRGE